MNFFEQQDHARRQTRTLILLFILAVVAIVIAVNLAMVLVWSFAQGGYSADPDFYPRGFFATNTTVTLALIAVGTLIETWNLRDGGDAVAKMAGGRQVSPASREPRERRLLNVVEEMALASGVACPKVYVLDKEEAINAFAAGYNRNEAVVAVTRGALARLTRDELQGVVAHEFSHILNGDMRLNIRLIGVLFGIQMIAGFGQHLIDLGTRVWTVRRRDGKGPSAQFVVLASGFALLAVGSIGIFFGRLIKSAVSRQREFLADASAVQFTRNPDGIGGALRKIGGLARDGGPAARIRSPNAEQLSHLFLAAPRPGLLSRLLAAHPAIPERLRRIYGRQVDVMAAPELPDQDEPAAALPDIPYVATGFAQAAAAQASYPLVLAEVHGEAREPAQAGTHTFAYASALPALPAQAVFGADPAHAVPLPAALDSAIREPQAAAAVVYALLLGENAQREAQLALLQDVAPPTRFIAYLADTIAQLQKGARLPLLDLSMPALRQLPDGARAKLLAGIDRLIAADRRVTLAEFVLRTVLARRLDKHAGRAIRVKFETLGALPDDVAILLSLVAQACRHGGHGGHDAAHAAYTRGAATCPELHLPSAQLLATEATGFVRVQSALDRARQLAPLAKPALVKILVAAAGEQQPMPVALADLLRAICAAIDAPIPPAVAATYTPYHW